MTSGSLIHCCVIFELMTSSPWKLNIPHRAVGWVKLVERLENLGESWHLLNSRHCHFKNFCIFCPSTCWHSLEPRESTRLVDQHKECEQPYLWHPFWPSNSVQTIDALSLRKRCHTILTTLSDHRAEETGAEKKMMDGWDHTLTRTASPCTHLAVNLTRNLKSVLQRWITRPCVCSFYKCGYTE